MHGQINEDIKNHRRDLLMQLQLSLLNEINKKHINKVYEVLCEGRDGDMYVGRAYFQAPDVDGRIYFTSDCELSEGEFVKVYIEKSSDYDLYGYITQQ